MIPAGLAVGMSDMTVYTLILAGFAAFKRVILPSLTSAVY